MSIKSINLETKIVKNGLISKKHSMIFDKINLSKKVFIDFSPDMIEEGVFYYSTERVVYKVPSQKINTNKIVYFDQELENLFPLKFYTYWIPELYIEFNFNSQNMYLYYNPKDLLFLSNLYGKTSTDQSRLLFKSSELDKHKMCHGKVFQNTDFSLDYNSFNINKITEYVYRILCGTPNSDLNLIGKTLSGFSYTTPILCIFYSILSVYSKNLTQEGYNHLSKLCKIGENKTLIEEIKKSLNEEQKTFLKINHFC